MAEANESLATLWGYSNSTQPSWWGSAQQPRIIRLRTPWPCFDCQEFGHLKINCPKLAKSYPFASGLNKGSVDLFVSCRGSAANSDNVEGRKEEDGNVCLDVNVSVDDDSKLSSQ